MRAFDIISHTKRDKNVTNNFLERDDRDERVNLDHCVNRGRGNNQDETGNNIYFKNILKIYNAMLNMPVLCI